MWSVWSKTKSVAQSKKRLLSLGMLWILTGALTVELGATINSTYSASISWTYPSTAVITAVLAPPEVFNLTGAPGLIQPNSGTMHGFVLGSFLAMQSVSLRLQLFPVNVSGNSVVDPSIASVALITAPQQFVSVVTPGCLPVCSLVSELLSCGSDGCGASWGSCPSDLYCNTNSHTCSSVPLSH